MVWNVASKTELMRLGGHKESITGVAFSPDGALVATTCADQKTRIWDVRDGRALAVVSGPGLMRSLAFSPDGAYLAASAAPGPVSLRKRLPRVPNPPGMGVYALAFDSTGRRLAAGDEGGTVIVWDVDSGKVVRRLNLDNSPVRSIVFLKGGRYLAVRHTRETVALVDLERTGEVRRTELHARSARLVVDHRETRLLVGDDEGDCPRWR